MSSDDLRTNPIVVLGGGFAGFWAAIAARRHGTAVTLVSRSPVLEMRPRFYEAAPETLGLDMRPLLDRTGIQFVQAEASGLINHALLLVDGTALPYARLVIATGSVLRRPPIPGADTAFSIDTQTDAIAFDRHLATLAGKPTPRIAVIGAGFTGIELALELRDRLNLHRADGEAAEILLIDAAPDIGPELGPGPRPVIAAALSDARIQLRLATRVARIALDSLTFADNAIWPADAVVLTTGMTAAPFAALLPGPRDTLGRILVNAHLRASTPDIFVTGDAAAADVGDGNIAVQSCQHALRMGRYAGTNAARDLLGKELIPYSQLSYGNCLDLGRAGAVRTAGWDRQVIGSGPEAKAVKRNINTVIIYPPANASADELLAQAEV